MQKNRKEELLEIAYKLFITKGYDNTSVDEIISEANIAKGTYYYYFTSKEEMLDQVINEIIEKEIVIAKEYLNKPLTVEQKLVGVITSLRPTDNETSIVDALNDENNLKMHKKYSKKIIESAIPILKEVVQEGIKTGIFNCDNIEERIKIILIISNDLFDNNNFNKKEVDVFIDTVEKILGAKKGTMKFISKLIGG